MSNEFWDKIQKEADSLHLATLSNGDPEISQRVLYLKQIALQAPSCKEWRDGKSIVSEHFLNCVAQLCYDDGRASVEKRSYEQGWDDAMTSIEEKVKSIFN
jgi:hypothetical protein